jgi:hypothetical protein
MANYNTFIVVDCKSRKSILTTSSARKAKKELVVGNRIDVWNDNQKIKTIYSTQQEKLKPYVLAEKEYIRKKQEQAEQRNKRRKERCYGKQKPTVGKFNTA